MPLDGERSWVYDTRYGVDWLSTFGGWVRSWLHWVGRGIVLSCNKASHVDLLFIHCTEKEAYARRLSLTVAGTSSLENEAPVTDNLDYVTFTHVYHTLQFLTKFDYWCKNVISKQRSRIRTGSKLLVNNHCINIFVILNCIQKEPFVQVQPGGQATGEISCCLSVSRLCSPINLLWSS